MPGEAASQIPSENTLGTYLQFGGKKEPEESEKAPLRRIADRGYWRNPASGLAMWIVGMDSVVRREEWHLRGVERGSDWWNFFDVMKE